MKHTTVRIPGDLRAKLQESADRSRRSLQAELWVILEERFGIRSGETNAEIQASAPSAPLAASSPPKGPQIIKFSDRVLRMSDEEFEAEIEEFPDVDKMMARAQKKIQRHQAGIA